MANFLIQFLSSLTTTQILLTSVIVLAFIFYWYATSYHGVWEKLGVPGPKPLPFIDHRLELREGLEPAYNKWFTRYGKTFGLYGLHPHKATLVTKDLDIIKAVMVKDFDNFINRYRQQETKASMGRGLSSVGKNVWRRHRQVTTPMFTGAKMKIMMRHVTKSAHNLAQLIAECVNRGEVIPVKMISSKFAAEVIARIGFGVETHAISKEESQFAYHARNYIRFGMGAFWRFITTASYFFPPIIPILLSLTSAADFVDKVSDDYFIDLLKNTMAARKAEIKDRGENGKKIRDMLDLMMEASVSNDDPRLRDSTSRVISEDEVVANSTMLILAGVETVSTTLQGILFCVASRKDVQDKMLEEIDQVAPRGEDLDYDHLSKLKYTEQVIFEGLRLFPILSYISRLTSETKTYHGVTIPRGAVVNIPIGQIMVDPEYWSDPDKFDPDRFSPENSAGRDPLTFMPFGYGPRVCLGQRLAMMELKTILVYLLRQFRLGLSDRTHPKKGEVLEMTTIGPSIKRPKKLVEIEAYPR